MKIKTYLWMLLACLACAACEDLEDTYDEFAGNGEIRYTGSCTNLQVTPGWKRLVVTWENTVDPVVVNTMVRWTLNGVADSVVLDKTATAYDITGFNGAPELANETYEVVVCTIDNQGKVTPSLPRVGRPYTEAHEEIATFTRLVRKQYYVGDRLVLFFTDWQGSIESAAITYTNAITNKTETLELDSLLVSQKYYIVEEPVKGLATLKRTGRLEDCPDLITFADYELRDDKLYTADFLKMMRVKEGFQEIPADWAEKQKEVDYDESCTSFEDILNLPNLETIYLGRNRYLTDEGAASTEGQCMVYDSVCSNFVLEAAHELLGVKVVRYNEHYPSVICDFIEERGNTNEQPEFTYKDLIGKKFTSNPADPAAYPSGLEYLTDGDPTTSWKPASTAQSVDYELTLDLGSVQQINGLKFVQRDYGSDREMAWFAPSVMKIAVSNNGATWEYATYVEEVPLGNSTGETCFVPFVSGGKQARFIRLAMTSQGFSSYSVTLAEIGVY